MAVNCADVGGGGVLFPTGTKNAIHHAKSASCMTEAEASRFMRPETHNQARQWESIEYSLLSLDTVI